MKVLVACEESQAVCKAFRERGHEAYSADIQDCSGGHPEWHILGDVTEVLNPTADRYFRYPFFKNEQKGISFETMDGQYHQFAGGWDLIIAHPPCTYLSSVTTRHLSLRVTPAEKVVDRMWKVAESAVFFMQIACANCDKIAIKNPVGYMSRLWRKQDQIIHPYFFAKDEKDIANYQKKADVLMAERVKSIEANNKP